MFRRYWLVQMLSSSLVYGSSPNTLFKCVASLPHFCEQYRHFICSKIRFDVTCKKIPPSVIFLCDSRYLGMQYSYRNNTGTRTIRRCLFSLEFDVNTHQILNLSSGERRTRECLIFMILLPWVPSQHSAASKSASPVYIDLTDRKGRIALAYTALKGYSNVVKLLLYKKANAN